MRTTANQRLLKITTTAAMIAFTCVLTMVVRIPSPTKGYLNLGDAAVLLVAIKMKEEDPLTIGYIVRTGGALSRYGEAYREELLKYKEI